MIGAILARARAGRPWLGAWTPALVLAIGGTAIALLVAIVPHAYDTERYWLAWIGERVLHGTIPSVVGAESPYDTGHTWTPVEWLYAAGVAWFRDRGIYPAFALLNGLAAASLLWWALGKCIARRVPRQMSFFVLLGAAAAFVARFQLRAEAFADLFVVVTLLWCGSPRLRWLLPLLFVVWANVHSSFAIGLAVVAISAIRDGMRRGFGGFVLLALCIVATLVNPFGIGIWEHLWWIAHSWIPRWASEWQPLLRSQPAFVALLLLPLLPLVLRRAVLRKPAHLDWLLWPLLSLAALAAVRFLPLAAAIGVPAGAGLFRQRDLTLRVASVALAASLVAILAFGVFAPGTALTRGAGIDPDFGEIVARSDPAAVLPGYPLRGKLVYCWPASYCNIVLLHGGLTMLDGRTEPFTEDRVRTLRDASIDWKPMRAYPFVYAVVAPESDPLAQDRDWHAIEAEPLLRVYERR